MNDWQKEYKLVQHTPLIHFQHSEPHACLRATEVKPKLDRFLIEQLEKDDRFGDGRWKKWFVGDGSQQSFDYMMRITPNSEQVERTQSIERAIAKIENQDYKRFHGIHKNYFGNMASEKKREEKKKAIRETFKESLFYKDGLTLTIRCFIPELLTFIDEHIRGFFMMHNFGTRQRKGFGSFTVDISTEPNAPEDCDLVGKYCQNAYYCELDGNVSANALLNAVWVISGFLKSGFNLNNNKKIKKKMLLLTSERRTTFVVLSSVTFSGEKIRLPTTRHLLSKKCFSMFMTKKPRANTVVFTATMSDTAMCAGFWAQTKTPDSVALPMRIHPSTIFTPTVRKESSVSRRRCCSNPSESLSSFFRRKCRMRSSVPNFIF